jgi:hypothetical protein
MGNGYPIRQPDPLSQLAADLGRLASRVATLEKPSGTQTADALKQLTALVNNLATEIANVASSGATWTGPVADPTGVGISTGGPLSATASVKFPAVFSNPITTAFRVVYNGNGDGSLGFNLSSRRYKQDIAGASLDVSLLAQLRVVTFRYIAAVEQFGDEAATEVGLIAEEVDELGLKWLVDYDPETGVPDGIKFDRLAVAALGLAEGLNGRVERIEAALGLVADGNA